MLTSYQSVTESLMVTNLPERRVRGGIKSFQKRQIRPNFVRHCHKMFRKKAAYQTSDFQVVTNHFVLNKRIVKY